MVLIPCNQPNFQDQRESSPINESSPETFAKLLAVRQQLFAWTSAAEEELNWIHDKEAAIFDSCVTSQKMSSLINQYRAENVWLLM